MWGILPITVKLYVLCLVVASVYTTYFLARTLLHLYRMPLDTNIATRLIEMSRRIENLRQFHMLLSFLPIRAWLSW